MTLRDGTFTTRRFVVVTLGGAAALAIAHGTTAERAAAKPACAGGKATQLVDPVKLFALGTQRDDVISGTPRDEKIVGRRGDDRACGHAGRDLIKDGPGADRVRSGSGRDRVRGGKGRDRLRSGNGRDRVKAADGARDRVAAGSGRDRVNVRDGVKDSVNCGPGRDSATIDNLDRLKSCNRVTLGGMADFALPPWSDALWSDPSSYTTVQAGDINGDGKDELVGRSPFGIETWAFDEGYSKPTGQWAPLYNGAHPDLSDADGWNQPEYYSTIQLADVNGGGAEELLARAGDGLHVWEFESGSDTWNEIDSARIAAMSDSNGFSQRDQYETIQAADIDGDHVAEVLGRESDGVHVWKWNSGTQGFNELSGSGILDDLDNQAGQTDPQFYSTIQTGDLEGDGRQDVLARIRSPETGTAGMAWWRFLPGDGWVAQPPIPVGTNPGLASPSQYSTIQIANLDSDRQEELLVRLSDGVHEYEVNRYSFNIDWNELPALGRFADGGWAGAPYYSTIQTADVDGDGPAEVLARAPSGLVAFKLEGKNWQQVGPTEADFSDANGWNDARYYSTIQTAHIGAGAARDVIARGVTGVQTVGLNAARRSWGTPSTVFPDYSSGTEFVAYEAINKNIGGNLNKTFDLRSSYSNGDAQQLGSDWPDAVRNTPKPEGVSDETWQAVQTELLAELDSADEVFGWFGDNQYLQGLATQIDLAKSLDASAGILGQGAKKNAEKAEAVAREWDMFVGIVTGLGGLGVVEGPVGDAAVVTSSLIGGAAAAGLGPGGVDDWMDGLQDEVDDLETRLQDNYTSALGGVVDARQEIDGDLGLQTAVGELITTDTWTQLSGGGTSPSGDYAAAIARAEHNYAVFSWQTITPALWAAVRFAPDLFHDWCQGGVPLYPKGNCEYQPGDGSGWTLAYPQCDLSGGPGNSCGPVQQGLIGQLTGQTSQACLQNWDLSNCSLGVSLPDVFLGRNGWQNLPLWMCDKRSKVLGGIKCGKSRG